MNPIPETEMLLARFWLDELDTGLERMDMERARQAIARLAQQLDILADFLGWKREP